MVKQRKLKSLGPADVFVIGLVCLFLMAVIPLLCHAARSDASRLVCARNLSTIGRAMMIYANDYEDKYPLAGGALRGWARHVRDWKAKDRFGAYGITSDGSAGQASITSCFYLLVKYAEVQPKTFVCPSDIGTTEFNPADEGLDGRDVITLWDFGSSPGNHCSYAYHMPFSNYALTTSSDPGMAVAADRNPWFPSGPNDRRKTWNEFNPLGDMEAVKLGNSISHEEDGQNVLFMDGHVGFEESPSCGVDDDNIYTTWNHDTKEKQKGSMPLLGYTQPHGRTDSILLHEPASYEATTMMQAEPVDSNDLERTIVVAILDSPIPEHKNIIWCSTFQMAWDKLKNDIIGEPVQLRGAEELVTRLNQAEFSPDNLEENSFYATADFVGKGIIEQIQKEIKERFDAEPVTSLNEFISFEPATIVTFSYLDINVGFKYPFHTNEDEFTFVDSAGTKTNVTSFRTVKKESKSELYEQVDILFYKQNKKPEDPEFALDLCKYTKPYQIVLARVQRGDTLAQTLAAVEENIVEFKKDPDYKQLREVRNPDDGRGDSVIVPDVLFKLTHRFKELIGKHLGNEKWSGYFIAEAMQMIDFTLSRTGVTIKSWSHIIAPPFSPPPPRDLHFNKPFLIYVKKRGAENKPFFVMWVDNAELMKEF